MGFSANISQCGVYELVIVYSFCTAFLTFTVSFIWLQFLLKEEYNNWVFPWVVHAFNRNAYRHPGNFIRYIFLGSIVIMVMLVFPIVGAAGVNGNQCIQLT